MTTRPAAEVPMKEAELDQKRARYNEVMEILNPKEEQALDSMEEDAVQYQQRKRDDEKPKKRSRYSETETLFMSWANGSAPVGEVKRFARFGKHRYYEKTETGCVELSRAQYNERSNFDAQNIDRRAEREISQIANYYGSSERNAAGSIDGDRNSAGVPAVSGQAFGEKLRNDTRRGISSVGGRGSGTAVTDSNDIQHQQRTGTLSNREVLELAASDLQSVDLTQAEKDALNIFTGRLDKLGALQQERKQLGDLYREQQFGTRVDREAAKQTLNRMNTLDGQIKDVLFLRIRRSNRRSNRKK